MEIVIFGPPGGGKGSEAKELAKHFKLRSISVGALLRKEVRKRTKLGRVAEPYMLRGLTVPNKYVYDLVNKEIKKAKRGYIIDDFPRCKKQAKNFKGLKNIDYFIFINASKKTIMDRVKHRAREEHREDDKLEILKQRLKIYRRDTLPLIKSFSKKKNFIKIVSKGIGKESIKRTFKMILDKLEIHRKV